MTLTATYPLDWPIGWKRAVNRDHHRLFTKTFENVYQGLGWEIERLRARGAVFTSWLPVDKTGLPRADMARRILEDPGVAVYFELRGRRMAMARDAYLTVADNARSLAMAIEYMRGLERHGGSVMMERAFEGFAALPAPGKDHWRMVLGVGREATIDDVEAAYRRGAKSCHADAGGSHDAMSRLNVARDQARRELGA